MIAMQVVKNKGGNMIAKAKSTIFISLSLLFIPAVLFAQKDMQQKRHTLVDKGEYIIGDMYEWKLLKISGPASDLMKEKYFREFQLAYDYSIDIGAYDGRTILMLVNKERFKEYLDKLSAEDDPNKYHKMANDEYPIYASYRDAMAFCQERGGRIPKDYELEIGLKYYRIAPGIKYQEQSDENQQGIHGYYEFAVNVESKPMLMKYFAGSIDGITSRFIFIAEHIAIKEDEALAASTRCVYDNNDNRGQPSINE